MSKTEYRYFRIDWYHSFQDEPVKYFEQVDAEGAVVRAVKKFATGKIVWSSLIDSENIGETQMNRTNLIGCNFDSLKYGPHPAILPEFETEAGPYLTKIKKQDFEDAILNAKSVGQREM